MEVLALTPKDGGGVRMKREINTMYGVSIITSILIGSGIFVSPVSITQQCGSILLSLLVWVGSGLLTLMVCLCFCELGSIMPRAGGDYAFTKGILGRLPAFLLAYSWYLAANPPFFAVLALTTAHYSLKPFYPDCPPPDSLIRLLTIFILVSVAAVNCSYVKLISKVQVVFTASKVLALSLIICGGIMQVIKGKAGNLSTPLEGTTTNAGNVAMAMYSGYFTYAGWVNILALMEEVKEPEKCVPRCCIISMLLVILLYLLTNLAYFTVLSPQQMPHTTVVAMSFAEVAFGKISGLIPIFVAMSTIGALNGALLGSSRVYFAAARDGLFPAMIALVSEEYLTPWMSIWSSCGLALVFALTGSAVYMIEYLGFLLLMLNLVVVIALLMLRFKEPHLHRPFKVPLVLPVLSFIFLSSLLVLGLYQSPLQFGSAVLIVLLGLPIYWVCVAWETKPRILVKTWHNFTVIVQKSLLLVPTKVD